jgi:TonB family protein
MRHWLLYPAIALIATLPAGLAYSSPQQASLTSNGATSPLVQVEHLVGDQSEGFVQECLLVYADGRYRHEIRRQESVSGHPKPVWQPAKVFENAVQTGELQKLTALVDAEDFRAISGTVGDPSVVPSNLLFWPLSGGGVTPHGNMDIVAASIAHPRSGQTFEVFLGTTHLENSLKSFLTWINDVEKRKEGLLDKAVTNNCTTSSSLAGTGLPWEPMTSLVVKPMYTPGPDYPIDERNARHAGTVLVEATVNVDGSVGQVSIKRGINPLLDQKALDAVRKWKFAPAQLNSVPLAMRTVVKVDFRLQ